MKFYTNLVYGLGAVVLATSAFVPLVLGVVFAIFGSLMVAMAYISQLLDVGAKHNAAIKMLTDIISEVQREVNQLKLRAGMFDE
jgi:hypothetical protein